MITRDPYSSLTCFRKLYCLAIVQYVKIRRKVNDIQSTVLLSRKRTNSSVEEPCEEYSELCRTHLYFPKRTKTTQTSSFIH